MGFMGGLHSGNWLAGTLSGQLRQYTVFSIALLEIIFGLVSCSTLFKRTDNSGAGRLEVLLGGSIHTVLGKIYLVEYILEDDLYHLGCTPKNSFLVSHSFLLFLGRKDRAASNRREYGAWSTAC